MDITVDTSQLEAMARRYAGARPIVEAETRNAMNRATVIVQGTARQLVPVDTGRLRASIATEIRGTGGGVVGVVGSNVKYARIVEEGRGPVVAKGRALRFEIGGQIIFRKSVGPAKGKPYLRPALQRNRARIGREFDTALKRIMARIGVSG